MKPIVHTLLAALLLAVLSTPSANAQTTCTAPTPDCVVVGKLDFHLSLGYGERTNPLADGSDIPLVVVPHLSYYGERFFLEDLELGYSLYEDASNTINLIAAPGYDRVFFVRDDPQNFFVATGAVSAIPRDDTQQEIPHRSTTYLAGPEWHFDYRGFAGQLNALYEVTGRHKGYEVRGAFAAPLIESTASLKASAGFTWKSAEVVRYYYGLPGRYEPGSAFNPFVKLGYVQPLSRRWTLRVFAHYERLGGAIADSPLVADDNVVTVFAGLDLKIL
jgi:outer membrane protein